MGICNNSAFRLFHPREMLSTSIVFCSSPPPGVWPQRHFTGLGLFFFLRVSIYGAVTCLDSWPLDLLCSSRLAPIQWRVQSTLVQVLSIHRMAVPREREPRSSPAGCASPLETSRFTACADGELLSLHGQAAVCLAHNHLAQGSHACVSRPIAAEPMPDWRDYAMEVMSLTRPEQA